MLKEFASLFIFQTLSSILTPYGAIVFRVFLQKSSRLRRFVRLVLSMIFTETSFKHPLRLVVEKCLKRCSFIAGFRTVKLSVIVNIINPSKSESGYSLTHILFQACSMFHVVCFMDYRTGKGRYFTKMHTHSAVLSITFT